MASVSLTHGNTEYELAGPDAAPLVVLLHGASIPLWTWDAQVSELHAAGFRTLRYDMYGRGKSAYPQTVYDRELYQRQLLELLDALTISQPFHLVGFSFGGALRIYGRPRARTGHGDARGDLRDADRA